jgi:cyclopropane fatty-acyl-phospholipid synthase-like methyltransferase
MKAPVTSQDFNRSYAAPMTPWGDFRIPSELKELIARKRPTTALELGCGLGRISRYMAGEGLEVTGVDFSSAAIAKARSRTAGDAAQPRFLVGDVTNLGDLEGPFDISVDVGCFHCLGQPGQRAYAAGIHRLLSSGGTHLLWVMDDAPSDLPMNEEVISNIFAPGFELEMSRKSRRRLVSSRWFWLTKTEPGPE